MLWWRSGVLALQISDIRSEGWSAVRRKITNLWRRTSHRLAMWLNALWAIPLVILMRALRPLVTIRLGSLDSTRIGHFAFDAACHVTELRRQPPNIKDWFWLGPTCNSQWELMVRRTLPIVQATKWVDIWNQRLPGGESHSRPLLTGGAVPLGQVLETPRSGMIPFLPSENEQGLTWLKRQGWTDGEPFFCLLVRDSAFLANDPLQNRLDTRNSSEKWSYHDYRDSKIEDYVPAMEWLAGQGVWVFRMGKIMERPMPTEHPRIVDYAFEPSKSDFLDIWLFANCTGCISTATGIDAISTVYGVPNLFVNATALADLLSFHESMWVPKFLTWRSSGQGLSLCEYLEHPYGKSAQYEIAGIEFTDLSSDEILSAVQEFWLRFLKTWHERPGDILLQERFWEVFSGWNDFALRHFTINPKSRVGTDWLRNTGTTFLMQGIR